VVEPSNQLLALEIVGRAAEDQPPTERVSLHMGLDHHHFVSVKLAPGGSLSSQRQSLSGSQRAVPQCGETDA
jgi:hypothetical protein